MLDNVNVTLVFTIILNIPLRLSHSTIDGLLRRNLPWLPIGPIIHFLKTFLVCDTVGRNEEKRNSSQFCTTFYQEMSLSLGRTKNIYPHRGGEGKIVETIFEPCAHRVLYKMWFVVLQPPSWIFEFQCSGLYIYRVFMSMHGQKLALSLLCYPEIIRRTDRQKWSK